MAQTRMQTIIALALLVVTTFPFADPKQLERGYIAEYKGAEPTTTASVRWDLERIQAYDAWQTMSESGGVIVAVLDTGIDAGHTALAAKVIDQVNFSRSETTEDRNGHGTHIAGIIAAAGQTTGSAGVAYNARLLNVKIAGDDGMADQWALAQGITWAADHEAKVINISVVFNKSDTRVEEAVAYAQAKGAIIVAAAGNGFSTDPKYPAAYPGVIGVAATGQDDSLTRWSNHGDWVTVDAPGVAILGPLPDEQYGMKSGTSAAAALVSGEAALLFAECDQGEVTRTADEIRQAIITAVEPVHGSETGRINVLQAIMAAQ